MLFSQITIGSQQVTLNALQVATLAIDDITSGIAVFGSKPFAAFSGSMAGIVSTTDHSMSYTMVS